MLDGAATIEDLRAAPLAYTLSVKAGEPARLRINTFYFPEWEITVWEAVAHHPQLA